MLLPQNYDALIVGNGEYPNNKIVLRLIENAPYVVCCDGAADTFYERQKTFPNLVIGDGDSLSVKGREQFAQILLRVEEQESNDQTKAVRWLAEKGFNKLVIVGVTGRREDHTLGNISLLIDYMRMGLDVTIATDYGCFTAADGNRTFESYKGQQVSIFSFGAKKIKGEGLVYPLHDFTNWWQGTLNEAIDSEFTIECDGTYIVYRTY